MFDLIATLMEIIAWLLLAYVIVSIDKRLDKLENKDDDK